MISDKNKYLELGLPIVLDVLTLSMVAILQAILLSFYDRSTAIAASAVATVLFLGLFYIQKFQT
jgi:hypothetical protein